MIFFVEFKYVSNRYRIIYLLITLDLKSSSTLREAMSTAGHSFPKHRHNDRSWASRDHGKEEVFKVKLIILKWESTI